MASIEQQTLNYHSMQMPVRPHHPQQMHTQLLQRNHQHQQRTPFNTSSERGSFPGPLAALDRAKTSSASDDGETSSASEDSAESYSAAATASYKRPAESSGCFRLPPSQRLRTTSSSPLLQHPGWLPVSSGGTFNTGNPNPAAAAGRQQQRQLPRLAALETLMSSHNNQQYQQPPEQDQHPHRRSPTLRFHQQQPHHHRQDFPLGPHAPTTRLVSRTNATVQLPSLSREMKSSGGSSVGSRPSSSASSSPTCSPGLRSASPPFGGRYELPPPACTQGGASAAAGLPSAGGGSVDVNQRWLVGAAGTNTHTRRQVPRIDALSPTKNAPGASAAAFQARQPWHNATAAPEAAAAGGSAARAAANGTAGRWPEHEGEGRRGVIGHSHASGAASASYAREVGEDRSNVAWARQHGAGAAWPLQQHREHHQQLPSESAARPSSRTPSPLSFRHGHGHGHGPSAGQQQQQQDTTLSGASSTFGSSSSSPEKRAWTPPILEGGARPASAVAGETHRGKWDEETQARASGSEGKQILQRYLTHLYPKASREVWSHDEEEVLWRAQKEYGNAWSYISSLLPGRSENAVKNHWYTQMRMFIGQRGNNASSSKPCPPPFARAASKSAGGKGGGSRHNKRKPDDENIHASKQQQQRTSPPGSPVRGRDSAHAAAPSWTSTNINDTNEPSSSATVAKEEAFDVHEEKQARADAVAALGMLFSQGNTPGAASTPEDNRR